MVPDRLSYSEMGFDTFKYPSEWTESYSAYEAHRPEVCNKIMQYMNCYEKFLPGLNKQVNELTEHYFSCNKLLEMLK